MEHIPYYLSLCNQKGGVGKSSLTVFLASWLHYIARRDVLVVDCDFPQWSIHAQRERELRVLERSDYYKLLLLRQFRTTQRRLWPLVRTSPPQAIDAAARYMERKRYNPEFVLYDLPGTVNAEGVLTLACSMDALIIPLKADKTVVESSLAFARQMARLAGREGERLRAVYLFWTMVDNRERTPLYEQYEALIERLGLRLLHTRIAYRSRFNKELLPDGAGVGRSTLLAAERAFAGEAGIVSLAEEIQTIAIDKNS